MPINEKNAQADFTGSRRYQRVGLNLPGRYMLQDQREFLCSTINVSANGLAVESSEKVRIGETVVVYINQLGRIEGKVARQLDKGFAIATVVSPAKIEKLIARINWLVERQQTGGADERQRERAAPEQGQTVLRTPDGGEYFVTLFDVSSRGAAMKVACAPPIGAAVTIGKTQAHVVRHFAGGIAVTFQGVDASAAFLADPSLSDDDICRIASEIS
jgi:PilZ domain